LDDSVSQSQKIFDEIGNRLRSQREVLSLSMADVERYAHLPRRHLLALEEGRIEDLPSTVQGRGMLANYASFLNLNSEELLLRFADGLQARRAERLEMDPDDLKESAPKRLTFETRIPAFNIKLPPALQKLRRKITADMVIGASLVTILVGFIIWSVAMLASTGISNSTTPPAVADILLSSGTPVAATLGAGETQQATLPPVNGTVLPGNTTLQPTVPSAGSGAIQVYIVSRQRVYMRVTVDGNVKYNARTVPGETYPFSGNSQIEVQANNASGLQIYYNQKDMGILGNMGQLLDITFTKEGATTAVPKPSITPQTTLTPTGEAVTAIPQITNTPTAVPTAVPTK
jgi:cytoskeletal protein RodZ